MIFDVPRWVAAYERGLRVAVDSAAAAVGGDEDASARKGRRRRRRRTELGGERRLPHAVVWDSPASRPAPRPKR